jgi:hypothetical protein
MPADPSGRPPGVGGIGVAAGLSGAAVAAAVGVRFGGPAGLGFAVGLAWGLVNFAALAGLLRKVAGRGKVDRPGVIRMAAAKVAVYAAGIALLVGGWFPILAMAAGFTWLLVVIFLRALGAWVTGTTKVVN